MTFFEHWLMVFFILAILSITRAEVMQRVDFENAEPYTEDFRDYHPTPIPPGIGSGNHDWCRLCRLLRIQQCINRFCQITNM